MLGQKKEGARFGFLSWELGRVSLIEKALFAKNLSVMLSAGIPIAEALDIIADTARGKIKRVVEDMARMVRGGYPFSYAVKRHQNIFGDFFGHTVYAGEQSGTLAENLENVSRKLRSDSEFSSKIKRALAYPALIFISALVLSFVLAFWVLPKLTPMFLGLDIDLPLPTRVLIWFSNLVRDHATVLIISFAGVIVGSGILLRQRFMAPILHGMFLYTPIVGRVVKNVNIARFARTLGVLLKSGIPINDALTIAAKTTTNFYFHHALKNVADEVEEGQKLSVSLARHARLFPLLFVRMLHVAEESGRFEENLIYLADYYEGEVDASTKALASAIEPLLLIFVGLLVAGLALAIITPIYEITGNVRK